jgi:MFS family permease
MSAIAPEPGETVEAPDRGPWAPLRQASFRRFWIGGALSMTCYWMIEAALAWQMRLLSNADPLQVAMVTATMQLTVMVAVMPAGVLADLVDRRSLLVVSHAWLLLVVGLVVALTFTGQLTPGLLLLLAAAVALTQAARMPVIGSLVADIVDRPSLGAAVALNALSQNGARIVGPALAGILLGAGGVTAALAVAGVGLFVAGGVLATIRPDRHRPGARLNLSQFVDDARAQRRLLAERGPHRTLLLRFGGFLACASAVPALLPVVFQSGRTYGLMLALYGVGAVTGLLALGRPRSDGAIQGRATLAQGAHAAGLLLLAAGVTLGGTLGITVAAVALLCCGAAWLALSNAFMTAAQLYLPGEARGRGLSTVYAVGMGSMAAGGPAWGWLARHHGTATAFVAASVLSLLVLAALHRRSFGGAAAGRARDNIGP